MSNEVTPEIHVFANTHADKEYIWSGPRTRAKVVENMAAVFELFRTKPEFKHFHLDSQTSPIDTFLEARPQMKEEIKEHVRNGRLLIGPWHTLPDPFQISGESLVRNLLYGHRMAKEYGGVMKVGYNIFGWGQISQMPQIYQGFGIDSMIFYRGMNETASPKLEFKWAAPDGSEVLGIRFGEGYRLNFFHFVYLPVVFGRCHWGCPDYDWKNANGILFEICDDYSCDPNSYLLETKLSLDESRIPDCIERLLETFKDRATTPYYLASMGWDDGMPYGDLHKLIAKCQEYLGDRVKIVESTLPEYIDSFRGSVKDLDRLTGEMRNENSAVVGGASRPPLFAGILSARIPMKIKNAEVEMNLERWAEPASVFAALLGKSYDSAVFDEAWRHLFTNHSHDCIGGTHTDVVYGSIMERFSQAYEIAETQSYFSIRHISNLIDTSKLEDDQLALIVFNSTQYTRTEVVNVHIDTPVEAKYPGFVIEDSDGTIILPQRHHEYATNVYLHQPYDYNLYLNSNRMLFSFEAKDIPPFGYKTFRVRKENTVRRNVGTQVVDMNTMQNEFLRVHINPNGTLDVTRRENGKTYPGLLCFDDSGEIGGPCMPKAAPINKIINSLGANAQISLLRDGSDVTTFQVAMDLELPAKSVVDEALYPFPKKLLAVTPRSRSVETVLCRITSEITLRKGQKRVDVTIKVDNTASDHKLRVLFPTTFTTDTIYAEGQYDVVARQIRRVDSSQWFEDAFHTQPHRYFLDVEEEGEGIAIITKGTHEYEYLDYENRTVAVTLLRSLRTGPESRNDPYEPGAQTLGEHTFQFAIYPHEGNWEKGKVYEETYRKHVPLRVVQMRKKNGPLPEALSFFRLEPTTLHLSAIKQSESGDSIIVRFHNPSSVAVEGTLESYVALESAREVTLEELHVADLNVTNGQSVPFTVAPHRIFTMEIRTAERTGMNK